MQTVGLILILQATVPKYEALFYLYQMQVFVLKTEVNVSVIGRKINRKFKTIYEDCYMPTLPSLASRLVIITVISSSYRDCAIKMIN